MPFLLLTLAIPSIVCGAVIPLPRAPVPIPEPPTVTDFTPLTSEKQPPTALEITSSAHHLPRKEEDVDGEKDRHSRRRVRLHSHNSKVARTREVEVLNEKCNDEGLQVIMEEAMTPSLSTSKMVISERAARDFGAPFDVICARGHFSYYVEASTYCEVTRHDVTCFAYKSTADTDRSTEIETLIMKGKKEKEASIKR